MMQEYCKKKEGKTFLPAAYVEKSVKRSQVMWIIESLPDAQKAKILFLYYNDMSICEIAEIMGCKESTVTSRIAYVKQHIRKGVEQLEKWAISFMELLYFPYCS